MDSKKLGRMDLEDSSYVGRVGDRVSGTTSIMLNWIVQSRVFVSLILTNADHFEMSIFVYNVVLDMLELFTNFSKIFCLSKNPLQPTTHYVS